MTLAVLVGNPNAGKTTLFNALTGLRQKVGNYPGVTVECKEGMLDSGVRLLDLPGLYSLSPRSPEEALAAGVLKGEGAEAPDAIVAVADATNLERHLYLVTQLLELGRPLVLALNMSDLARARHLAIDAGALSRELGIPVVAVSALTGEGLEGLGRLLAAGVPAPRMPEGLAAAVREAAPRGPRAGILARYAWIRGVGGRVIDRRVQSPDRLTEGLDRVLTHRVFGLAAFLGLMFLVFLAIFSLAEIPMGWVEAGVAFVQDLVRTGFSRAGMAGGALEGLVVDGGLAGVGAVLVFLPQILILFFFIAVLEDSGYMARAAFLMDRFMRAVGLHGKSFIPLMSSFACAIPGIMATRTIENRKDRLATILVAPLMSCSARLPVYLLLVAAFVPRFQAAAMLGLYALGTLAAFLMARLFKSTLLKGPPPPFIMELPPYRVPALKGVLLSMGERSGQFVKRAGTVILAISMVLWFLASHPKGPGGAAPAMEATYVGCMGHAIEPAIRPLGFDWRIGVGLVTSFAAREVMVTTLATLYGVEGDDDAVRAGLVERLRRDYSPAVGVSLLVFFVLACQCMSTLAVVKRETGSWSWALFMLAYMTVLAYLGSLAAYQGLSRLA